MCWINRLRSGWKFCRTCFQREAIPFISKGKRFCCPLRVGDLTLFEALTGGAFDLNWQHSREFDQFFSKKSNARGMGGFGIGHVRCTNILTWFRGFQVKRLYLVLFSLYPSLFWELRDKRNLKNLQFWPESLGAMLEYWDIERGLLTGTLGSNDLPNPVSNNASTVLFLRTYFPRTASYCSLFNSRSGLLCFSKENF